MHKKTLKQLYSDHSGKVSDKWSLYLYEYDRLFAEYRDRPIRLLEIGIQNGGSLEVWSKYFACAEAFIGCDINPDCARLAYDDARVSVVIGDANDDSVAKKIVGYAPKFDIVIDDGSHRSSDIIKTFAKYFPLIEEGGLFVAEDLHCSFWQEFEGGLFDPFSSIAFFKRLADVANHEHWGVDRCASDVFSGFFSKYNFCISDEVLATVHSVEFVNSICVIRKGRAEDNTLGPRIIAGTSEVVVPGHIELHLTALVSPSQSENEWALCELPPDEDYINLNEELSRREAQVASLVEEVEKHRAEIAQRDQEIRSLSHAVMAIERSTSWRITKPVRAIGMQLNRLKRGWKVLPAAVRYGGGMGSTLIKALTVFRHEGTAGVVRRLKNAECAQSAGSLGQAPGSDSFAYERWISHHDNIDDAKLEQAKAHISTIENPPVFSVVVPVFNPDLEWLIEAIESVQKQIYPHWELCIADDASTTSEVRPLLERLAREDKRLKVVFRESNGHISAATNSALELATGDFVTFLDQDDCLHPAALYELAVRLVEDSEVDILYTDEDKLNTEGRRVLPFFKPDWSPHLAISQAYLGHLVCYRASIVKAVGGLRPEFNGAQDYDLWLRASLKARKVAHVPHVLYHWRLHETSTSLNSGAKPYAHEAGRKAVEGYIVERYGSAHSNIRITGGEYAFTYKAEFDLPKEVMVSIIIPTRDRADLLGPCVESILKRSSWTNFEILILDNGSKEEQTHDYLNSIQKIDSRVRVIRADIPFNWSRLNNIGARESRGDVFIFLNNDTQVISPNWIESLVGYANLPDVGVVGGLLLFEDGTIQHSGVVVGMGGWADHVFRTQPPSHVGGGPFVSPMLTRNVLAVTGACAVITRSKFEELGKYDESFVICGSDVELCLRAHKRGYYNVMCAEARLYHYESKTRTPYVPETDFKQSELKYAPYRVEQVDPFYNPNLTLVSTTPTLSMAKNHA